MFFFDQAKCMRQYIVLLTLDLRIADELSDGTNLSTLRDSLSTRQSIQWQHKCPVPYNNHSHVRSRRMHLEWTQEKFVAIYCSKRRRKLMKAVIFFLCEPSRCAVLLVVCLLPSKTQLTYKYILYINSHLYISCVLDGNRHTTIKTFNPSR